MTINRLSLPVDVPWKRLCVSEDMIERDVCSRQSPPRWRSSVAVFSYEPPDEYQTYEDNTISYLKIACTITGYQPEDDEIDLKEWATHLDWLADGVETASNYYGCYGAILEVALAPKDSNQDVPLSDYPYIIDFEPKKREVYELVSDTGETLSRSLEQIAVGKGNTTSRSDEVVDILGGGGTSVAVNVKGSGGSGSQSFTGEKGTREINQDQYTNFRNIDQATENRESNSHTTQLSQMYHQLNSYHLGTNRSLFYMLPRPHVVQSEENTFVNGPRHLEGIQEFFLVVVRPKDMSEFCVKAYLETAHIGPSEPSTESSDEHAESTVEYETTAITPDDLLVIDPNYEKDAYDEGEYHNPGGAGNRYRLLPEVKGEKTYRIQELVGSGWFIDPLRVESATGEIDPRLPVSIGYRCQWARNDHSRAVYARAREVNIPAGYLTVEGSVRPKRITCCEVQNGHLELSTTIYLRKPKSDQLQEGELENKTSTLFLTGRGVCCCTASDSIFYPAGLSEGFFRESVTAEFSDQPFHRTGKVMQIKEANRIRTEIGQTLVKSVNHPYRYDPGTVSFIGTGFFGRSIAASLKADDHPDNLPVGQIKGIGDPILDRIEKEMPGVLRSRLLEMALPETIDRFALNEKEAHQLRRALVGIDGTPATPDQHWAMAKTPEVPRVTGVSLGEASKVIRGARLWLGIIRYQDSKEAKDTVIKQRPAAGTIVPAKSRVDLIVASGAVVQIPNLVGKMKTEGIFVLREAGLKSQPEIKVVPSKEYQDNQIIESIPESGSAITPLARVVLRVSSGEAIRKYETLYETLPPRWLLLIALCLVGAITALVSQLMRL